MENKTINQNENPSGFKSFLRNLRIFFRLEQTRTSFRKISASLWSIVFGLIIAMIFIVIATKGRNPFLFFTQLFKGFNSTSLPDFYKYFLIFGFAGLASALAFKGGLFNIGISGQMMSSGLISFSVLILIGNKNISTGYLFLCMFLSIILGFLISMIAGVLKAYLNVHEVITTIILNWIVVQLSSYIFWEQSHVFSDNLTKEFLSTDYIGTKPGIFNISSTSNTIFMVLGIIMLVSFIFASWFILKYTTLGYKIKMLGISKTNGKYMGVNDKLITILIMGFSGAIASLAGFYFYFFKENIVFAGVNAPNPLGFEAIAISLLALNSPIGIIFTSIFYATLYNGQTYTQLPPLWLEPDYIYIITALILYFAALSQLIMAFKPIDFLWKLITRFSDREYRAQRNLFLTKLKLARLNKKYAFNVHKIKMNIKNNNKEKLLTIYSIIENKYQLRKKILEAKILLYAKLAALQSQSKELEFKLKVNNKNIKLINNIDKKIEKSNLKISKVDKENNNIKIEKLRNYHNILLNKKQQYLGKEIKVSELKIIEYQKSNKMLKIKINELKEKTLLIINEIKNINLTSLDNKNISLNYAQFDISNLSNKEKIILLEKEFKTIQYQFLSKAMNYKNSDHETIENFSNITAKRREIGSQSFILGKYEIRDIRQQYIATKIIAKNELKSFALSTYNHMFKTLQLTFSKGEI
ncbi:ABC transporter permease subunit [Metamycoplasma buccale]|uniref:ABC transporter permease n=1 Tax=Metamycoplasma buccale TaxID=55602 RepID=UPI00398E6242